LLKEQLTGRYNLVIDSDNTVDCTIPVPISSKNSKNKKTAQQSSERISISDSFKPGVQAMVLPGYNRAIFVMMIGNLTTETLTPDREQTLIKYLVEACKTRGTSPQNIMTFDSLSNDVKNASNKKRMPMPQFTTYFDSQFRQKICQAYDRATGEPGSEKDDQSNLKKEEKKDDLSSSSSSSSSNKSN